MYGMGEERRKDGRMDGGRVCVCVRECKERAGDRERAGVSAQSPRSGD